MNPRRLSFAFVFLSLLGAATSVGQITITSLTRVGVFGGNGSVAYGVNDAGIIMGDTQGDIVFREQSGVAQNLGNLGFAGVQARGINASGDVVGWAGVANGGPHAFVYRNGTMTDLGTLGGSMSRARAINDTGQIVGESYRSDGLTRAFLHHNGSMIDLGTLGGDESRANGINAAGQIVGWSNYSTATSAVHPFLYANGVMIDLGTLGGQEGVAHDINASGQIVGWSHTANNHPRAFVYANGSFVELGTFGGTTSEAFAINAAGYVVGRAGDTFGNDRAFLWNGTSLLNLTSLAADHLTDGISPGFETLDFAYDINDQGMVVGYGRYFNGSFYTMEAFALTFTPIPEPATFVLLTLGLAALANRQRRCSAAQRRRVS